MSYLLLRGEMFHCSNCNRAFIVEFEGGPRTTQVGDQNVFNQWGLNKRYMPDNYNPEKEGYYFHSSVLCDNCVSSHIDEKTLIYRKNENPPFIELLSLADRAGEIIEEIAKEKIEEFINMVDLEYCKKIDRNAFDETIGLKKFKLLSHKEELSEEFCNKAKHNIDRIFNDFVQASNEYKEFYIEYINRSKASLDESSRIITENKKMFYIEMVLEKHVNLNPYICYENTVRKRIEANATYTLFKGPFNIPTAKIRDLMKKDIWDNVVKIRTPANEYLCNAFKRKIGNF